MSLLLDYLFPKKCFGCGKTGQYLCLPCLGKIKCLPVGNRKDLELDGCLSLFKYRLAIKKTIFELKYGFVSDMTDEISAFCIETIKFYYPHLLDYWLENRFVVIPVPLHQQRQNWRGFNQSELLADSIAAGLGLEYDNKALFRIKNTASQVKQTDKKGRVANVANSFLVAQKFSYQNIILFDDVLTTGSTLNAAFRAINSSSQIRCWGLTLAG